MELKLTPSKAMAGSVALLALVACSGSRTQDQRLGSNQAQIFEIDPSATIGAGSPSPRPTGVCPGGALPDRCGTWQGVELVATYGDASPPPNAGDAHCLCSAIDFEVPAGLPVTRGNAGTFKAELKFRNGTGPVVTCSYKGDRRAGHSGNATGGDQYAFERCSDGSRVGDDKTATWFEVNLRKGDGPTEVQLRLGEPDVVDGVVQEEVFYSNDPLIPEAALYVPRGAAPPFQGFTLHAAPQIPPGTQLANGGDPESTVGYVVDVNATGVSGFVFQQVPGASCARVELPYKPEILEGLLGLGAERRMQGRYFTDLDEALSGGEVIEPTERAMVDPLRKTLTFCVPHLSFVGPTVINFLADLTLVKLVDTATSQEWVLINQATPSQQVTSLPALKPRASYTLELTVQNDGSTTWTTMGTTRVQLRAVESTSAAAPLDPATSAWIANNNPALLLSGSVANTQSTTFRLPLVAPSDEANSLLNFCFLKEGTELFGNCFSWNTAVTTSVNSGFTPVQLYEVCDGLNNDNLGMADDGIPGDGTSCTATTGNGNACQGVKRCIFPAPGDVDANGLSCVRGTGPEICDTLDNDCNDQTDEVLGADCGSCGGKTRCNGSCTVDTPTDLDDPCGQCGGVVTCAGCSITDPANLGQSCSNCGGVWKCDTTCSVPDPDGYGQPCGSCDGVTLCNGCNRPTPADLDAESQASFQTYTFPGTFPFHTNHKYTFGEACLPGHEMAACNVTRTDGGGAFYRYPFPASPDCTCDLQFFTEGFQGALGGTFDVEVIQRRVCDPIEVCNGLDDDGDGRIDNGIRCRDVKLVIEGADDDTYVFIGTGGPLEDAVCVSHLFYNGGNETCDLTSIALGVGGESAPMRFTLLLGNGGGFNTQGEFYLMIDGQRHDLSGQSAVTAHTGWVHRHEFVVDFVQGTLDPLISAFNPHTCFNIGECSN